MRAANPRVEHNRGFLGAAAVTDTDVVRRNTLRLKIHLDFGPALVAGAFLGAFAQPLLFEQRSADMEIRISVGAILATPGSFLGRRIHLCHFLLSTGRLLGTHTLVSHPTVSSNHGGRYGYLLGRGGIFDSLATITFDYQIGRPAGQTFPRAPRRTATALIHVLAGLESH